MTNSTYTPKEWLEINFRKLKEGKITPDELLYDLERELGHLLGGHEEPINITTCPECGERFFQY